EHLVGRLETAASLLQADVVVDAHPGEHRDLFATQTRHTAPAPGLDAHVLGTDARSPGAQELSQLTVRGHVSTVCARRADKGGSVRPKKPRPLVGPRALLA